MILLSSTGASADEPKVSAAAATSWVLVRGRDIPAGLRRTPRLRMEGAKLSGSTGCNAFTASVVDKGDKRVSIEEMTLTRKLCTPRLDRAETAFLRALQETRYLERTRRRLTFLSDKRRPLLVWALGKSAARRTLPSKRYARARHRQHQRYAHTRYHRRNASFVQTGCRGRLAGAPRRRSMAF
jgi:heat shock protein HslJ